MVPLSLLRQLRSYRFTVQSRFLSSQSIHPQTSSLTNVPFKDRDDEKSASRAQPKWRQAWLRDRTRKEVTLPEPSPTKLPNEPTFQDLKLPIWLIHRLRNINISKPSIIQSAAIPQLLKTQTDFLIQDITGHGKTFAYLLPILANTDNHKQSVQSIILTPTRELAHQVYAVLSQLTNRSMTKIHLMAGNYNPSMRGDLQSRIQYDCPYVIIATPDAMQNALQDIEIPLELNYLILDEIDAQLSRKDTRAHIVPLLTKLRNFESNERMRVIGLSATITTPVVEFSRTHLQANYKYVSPHSVPDLCARRGRMLDTKVPERIRHCVFVVKKKTPEKIAELVLALICYLNRINVSSYEKLRRKQKEVRQKQSIALFVPHTRLFSELVPSFGDKSIDFTLLSEGSSRSERRDTLNALKGRSAVILATDLLSRGMHMDDLRIVINYSLPTTSTQYLHRAGRVGRLCPSQQGRGTVVTLVENESEMVQLEDILTSV